MSCPNCRSNLPIQYGVCPSCRAFVGDGTAPPARGNGLGILGVFGLMGVVLLSSIFVLMRTGIPGRIFGRWMQSALVARRYTPPPPSWGSSGEFPVVHGGIANAAELKGHGKLYFVPVGKQAISVQSLAAYYRDKFNINITILKKIEPRPSSCSPERRQCMAEEIIEDMAFAYPRIAADPDSKMIALTDEDIYPVSMGWDFTYSFREGNRFGVVSTRRADPTFWGDSGNEAERLANAKQMLTKYIGILYFHLPVSHDPTSIMYQPLTPNGGSDDIYESDIHPEESANGRWGDGWPCLSFRYSYDDGTLVATDPIIYDCCSQQQARSSQEEIVQIELNSGQFVDHSMEFALDSTPIIQLRRGSRSDVHRIRALGLGPDYNYNTFLSSDGITRLGRININPPDTPSESIMRSFAGKGFSPYITFQNRNSQGELYGSKVIWETDHFKLLNPDGSWDTYLACPNSPECYWSGHQDAAGNSLRFDRDSYRVLQRLTASDGQGVQFTSDAQHRIVEATSSNGEHVRYAYDGEGNLAAVTRVDNQVTLYRYDSAHRITEVAVMLGQGRTPQAVITNQYDSSGRVVKANVSGLGTFRIVYEQITDCCTGKIKVIAPSGQVWNVVLGGTDYLARTTPLRFPALVPVRNRH